VRDQRVSLGRPALVGPFIGSGKGRQSRQAHLLFDRDLETLGERLVAVRGLKCEV
jgi:hypothetical protein